MHRIILAFLIPLLTAGAALAQTDVYQQQPSTNVRFRLDSLLRQEWTRDIFDTPVETHDDDRQLFRALPRLELGGGRFQLAVGGEFNYGSDENVPEVKPALLRDNYKSREARLDLAYGRVEPTGWLRLEGGRFPMTVPLTEMLWDKDLRPQGAALTLQHKDASGVPRVGVTGLWAKGSHVFEDEDVEMILASGQVTFTGASQSSLQIMGSYLEFKNAERLEPMIRRQNTRVLGQIVEEYKVVDAVFRVTQGGTFPAQLVADLSWNTAVDEKKKGLWLAAVFGSLDTSLARGEYVYASVDRDATLAAYAQDDFFWATGWKGHRGEIATRISDRSSFHAIGMWQQFKDSPDPAQRDHWVKRYRLEVRIRY